MNDFDPNDLISLPRTSTQAALALSRMLITAAKAEDLPDNLSRTVRRLRKAHRALAERVRVRAADNLPADPRRREARAAENAAWSALQTWLSAWTRLPEAGHEEERETAKRAEVLLFADGQRFAHQRFEIAWAEAEQRLRILEEEDLGASLDAMGGAPFQAVARQTHEASGALIGMTKAVTPDPAPTLIAPALRDLRDVVREYVLLTSAHALEGGDAEARARRLLKPLTAWPTDRSRPSGDEVIDDELPELDLDVEDEELEPEPS